MSILLKRILKFAIALVALLVVVGIVLVMTIDANDYKEEISTAARDATGRELSIEGDIELSLFPWVGVTLGRTVLADKAEFSETPFAAIDAVDVKVKVLPLLRNEVQVAEIVLQRPAFNLLRRKDGVANWEDIQQELAKSSSAESETAEKSVADENEQSFAFTLGGVRIEDAAVHYTDNAAGQSAKVQSLDLVTGSVSLPLDTLVRLDAEVSLAHPEISSQVEFASRIAADSGFSVVELSDLVLTATNKGDVLPVSPLPVSIAVEKLKLDLSADKLDLRSLAVKTLGLEATLGGEILRMSGDFEFVGNLDIAEFNPSRLMSQLALEPLQTTDDTVLQRMTFASRVSATSNSASVEAIRMMLDDSTLTGRVAVTDIERQAMVFDLSLDAINADRYLPPPAETEDTTETEGNIDDIALPLELIRSLELEGQLAIGALTAMSFNSTDVKLGINAHSGKLRLNPISADFYDGGYRGDVTVDAAGKTAKVSFDEHLKTVSLGPLMKDLVDVEQVSGTARMNITGNAVGNTVGALKKTLSGEFDMKIDKGAIEGFNLWASMEEAYASVKGREYLRGDVANRTEFAMLETTGTITNGVVANTLEAALPFIAATGSGTADLLQSTVDYRIKAIITKQPELAGDVSELVGIEIPVSIKGPWASPKIRPEISAVLKQKAKQAVDAAKAEAEARVKEKLEAERRALEEKKEAERKRAEEKLKDKLKDIFK